MRRTCEATIVDVLAGEGWYYDCCPRCARKVVVVNESFYCNHCAKDAGGSKPRYRLIVRVEDTSARTSFTLFNKEAEELIGVPVDTIISELPQDAEVTAVPPVIRNIVGRRCAFDVKINAYNTERGFEEYTVFRLSVLAPGQGESIGEEVGDNTAKKQRTA